MTFVGPSFSPMPEGKTGLAKEIIGRSRLGGGKTYNYAETREIKSRDGFANLFARRRGRGRGTAIISATERKPVFSSKGGKELDKKEAVFPSRGRKKRRRSYPAKRGHSSSREKNKGNLSRRRRPAVTKPMHWGKKREKREMVTLISPTRGLHYLH